MTNDTPIKFDSLWRGAHVATMKEADVKAMADFVCWHVESLGELCYWLGGQLIKQHTQQGKYLHERS